MLIATLPPVHQEELLRRMISHPLVVAVRYNTGMDSAYSPQETLGRILEQTEQFKKPLWVDLKGRQLRIREWSSPPYGPILLNHRIKVRLPAKVLFRYDGACDLVKVVDGNSIYLDPAPRYAVGRGQSVNILTEDLQIEESFTENDRAYLTAAVSAGISRFMLSFVEDLEYIQAFEKIFKEIVGVAKHPNPELVLKIETKKGVDFIVNASRRQLRPYRLMAARDDLMLHIGVTKMIPALQVIINRDRTAICASRLLLGLEQADAVTMADVSDINLMQKFGYRSFMLSDGISHRYFDKVVEIWERVARQGGNRG